jgi:hypothetical protein
VPAGRTCANEHHGPPNTATVKAVASATLSREDRTTDGRFDETETKEE